jgi:predicted aminopeptidase
VWSFPVIGAITYVGWFDGKEARRFGAELAGEGWDVDVRPAGAYSTLGWFADPVLSSMIPEGDEATGALAEIILHESLHATFYVNGQSRLNESVASFVGRRLAIAYLTETVGAETPEMRAYVTAEAAGERRRERFRAGYEQLERLYASKLPDADKLAEKRRIIEALRPYGRPSRPINNAMLIQYKTYNSGMKEQEALLAACGGSYARYIRALAPLKTMRFPVQYAEVGEMIARLGNRCD